MRDTEQMKPAQDSDRKAALLARADRYEDWARIADDKAAAVAKAMSGDIHCMGQAKAFAQYSKEADFINKAAEHREKAGSIRRRANVLKGGRTARRMAHLATLDPVEVGSFIKFLGGWYQVVKVNAKSVRVEGYPEAIQKELIGGVISRASVEGVQQ